MVRPQVGGEREAVHVPAHVVVVLVHRTGHVRVGAVPVPVVPLDEYLLAQGIQDDRVVAAREVFQVDALG
ncbi:MAG: hypothetical protein ACK559_32305, partial [bacterium]